MANHYKVAALGFLLVSAVASMGFFRISEQIGDEDPIVMAGSFDQKGVSLEGGSPMFSRMFENEPAPADFIKKASSSIFDAIGGSLMSFSAHPKPDRKTKRQYVKLLLRRTGRRIKNVKDIEAFLEKREAVDYVGLDNPCEGLEKPCPYLDLKKKQLGRNLENLNDEIAFIEDILKKKECKYLKMKLAILKRDADSVQAIIEYIKKHNKLEDDHKDFIQLLQHIVCNTLSNLKDVKKFLKDLLEEEPHDLSLFGGVPAGNKQCPYLKLQERLQWREAVNRADSFGFVFWLRRRNGHSWRDMFKLKRRIRRTVRKLVRKYRHAGRSGRRRGNGQGYSLSRSPMYHKREQKEAEEDPFEAFDSSSIISLVQKSLNLSSLADTLRGFQDKLNDTAPKDDTLAEAGSKVTETA